MLRNRIIFSTAVVAAMAGTAWADNDKRVDKDVEAIANARISRHRHRDSRKTCPREGRAGRIRATKRRPVGLRR